jgi:poly-gamma-glutamate synthesis protein (capsule biosynthesis protein)
MKKKHFQNHHLVTFCMIVFVLSFVVINYYLPIGNNISMTVMSRSVNQNLNSANLSSNEYAENSDAQTINVNDEELLSEKNNPVQETNYKVVEEDNELSNKQTVSLLAVGDDLIHIEVYKSGKKEDGTLNYDHLFSNLKSDISKADIAVINQETILGNKQMGYSGYPNFCSPKEIGQAIIKAGFDVVLHGNNHILDKGIKGIESTLSFWKKQKNITVLGIHESQKKRDSISIIEKNGIKFALLNYTQLLNGHVLPSDELFRINTMNEEEMKEDIQKAKKIADVIVVFPHWGSEYSYKPDSNQKYFTKFFADEGVDLIIGTHPHVLQPIEWVAGKKGHKTLVYYSLGNYVSYQREAPRMLGGIANVVFQKVNDGIEIKSASITPIVTHYENNNGYKVKVYKLSEYSEALAKKHGIHKLEKNSYFSYVGIKKLAKDILGDWY